MSEFQHEPHNWLIHKLMWEHLEEIAPRFASGALLDIGCGRRPYREMFLPHIRSYIGLDYPAEGRPPPADVLADALALPIASASVDTVLFTELLEHLPRPGDAMREVHRVLRPGGHLILTTPMFWHLHEQPRDFYRYTKYGLGFLMEKSALRVVHMAELTGFVATFVQMGSYVVRRARWLRWATSPPVWLAQRIAYWINKLDTTRDFSCLIIAVGKKPGEAS